ncbi:prepilin-type N-terminal cleavage/methylation domain-containing protein [Clostridium aceticum]|uniref:Prepilin-type N-terminal cleavage/methylation domain-containing protein n=1 Tax=Clostridium aceticum TaxID=84022 RepID=A0A0D8IA80_9CLOT|nr:type II secretion system protein [Clostridium aceticum]AKL96356.1 prepilin-type N-terminal cleavage/methylation domain-containing protein [Clostridium aceticum]KJF26944.1 hypothetical protein TZ02_10440 [Clostridium aceticum]
MKKKLRKLLMGLKGNGGFTLLELIIVIAIMGFLAAMIAPRLAGAGAGAADTICDNNQTRLRQVTAAFVERTGQLPNDLINLIAETADGVYEVQYDDSDATNGKEDLSHEIEDSLQAKIHYLSDEEAAEIRAMGISHVRNLNLSKTVDGDHRRDDTHGTHMERAEVAEDLAVLMVAAGFDGTAWDFDSLVSGAEYRNPDLAYRIILGVGPDSELVTSGQIEIAGLCPNAIRRENHFAFGNYSIVLPRLAATVDSLTDPVSGDPITDALDEITVISETGQEKDINIFEVQEAFQFSTFCPEGDVVGTVPTVWTIQ